MPAEGKTKIDRPVVVFRGLGIPTYFVFDADRRHKGKANEAEVVAANTQLLRLAGSAEVDFPDTAAQADWAVFADDVEAELRQACGDAYYEEVRAAIAKELGYTEPSKVLKNPEASARLVRKTYADGKKIPILEKIVESVTALQTEL